MATHLLERLALRDTVDTEGLSDRSRSFDFVHLGLAELPIGELLDTIHDDDSLLPPRSGHLGNWEDIALGRSGPMDFNTAICADGYGYPLIFGFTQTETETGGDRVYLPGSVVRNGRRRPLPLYTWDGRRFTRRGHDSPRFCPLVLTEHEGELTPLVDVHLGRMHATAGYPFELEASVMIEHETRVVDLLCLLIEQAATDPNPRRAFEDIIGYGVRLDGTVVRTELQRQGAGYLLDGHHFASTRALAEAAMLPFRALCVPAVFFAGIATAPPVLPVVSTLLTSIFEALFEVDRRRPTSAPFVTHLHWGARSMAGMPPRHPGYLTRRARLRSMELLTRRLVDADAALRPLCFVLLPAPAFMLCPAGPTGSDPELMSDLLRVVGQVPPEAAYDRALGWLENNGPHLTDYLRSRFNAGSGVPHDGTQRPPALPVQPDGFRELTFDRAGATLSALVDSVGGQR